MSTVWKVAVGLVVVLMLPVAAYAVGMPPRHRTGLAPGPTFASRTPLSDHRRTDRPVLGRRMTRRRRAPRTRRRA